MSEPLVGRCGTCARFVRIVEKVDENGEVTRTGDCLLGVWPSPLKETGTCTHYVQRGTVHLRPATPSRAVRPRAFRTSEPRSRSSDPGPRTPTAIVIPEELLDMDADEFRAVLREVIRDELGASEVEL